MKLFTAVLLASLGVALGKLHLPANEYGAPLVNVPFHGFEIHEVPTPPAQPPTLLPSLLPASPPALYPHFTIHEGGVAPTVLHPTPLTPAPAPLKPLYEIHETGGLPPQYVPEVPAVPTGPGSLSPLYEIHEGGLIPGPTPVAPYVPVPQVPHGPVFEVHERKPEVLVTAPYPPAHVPHSTYGIPIELKRQPVRIQAPAAVPQGDLHTSPFDVIPVFDYTTIKSGDSRVNFADPSIRQISNLERLEAELEEHARPGSYQFVDRDSIPVKVKTLLKKK